MKFSIVTVCYNSASTIADTILSVQMQNHSNYEYIIIDGGSSDETLTIVQSMAHLNIHYISEKDAGIYDAMNKGISLATGQVIGFINSDDFYANPDVLSDVARVFGDASIDACRRST